MQAALERELVHGRIDSEDLMRLLATADDVRARFAALLGADAREIALTHHTTEGMNIGTWGLGWRPGDELVTTSLEHEGGLLPVYMAARRLGLTGRVVDVGLGDGDVVERLEQAFTARTRLLSISHVSFMNGAQFPLAEIIDMAHRHHVLVLVDGAQSAGVIPLDVHGLDVDLYAVPGQKWLCGPEGMGALYVRKDLWGEVLPTWTGFLSVYPGMNYDLTGEFMLAPDARRYEVGSIFRPGLYGMQASLQWLEEEVGWGWAFSRIGALAQEAAGMLAGLPGVRILTPGTPAGLVSFTLEGQEPEAVVNGLAARSLPIRIRWIKLLRCLRISTGFYNTSEDLLALREALVELVG
jgi:L-cysteine/cystine lyase